MAKTPFPATGTLVYSGFLNLYQTFAPTGNVWYVNSASGLNQTTPTGWGKSPDAPFATLQYAHDQSTSNNDDWVMLAPGHAETIASAGAITWSKNGITVVGKGWGSSRPTYTWSNTAGTFAVSGSGNRFFNLRCTCSVDEVVKLFNVTGANNCFDGIDYFETSTFQAIQFMLTSAAANYLTVQNCDHVQGTAAASAQKWIELVGMNRPRILNNAFDLTLNNAAGSYTINASTAFTLGSIIGNSIVQKGGTTQVSTIKLAAGSTGWADGNKSYANVTTLAGIHDFASCGVGLNYVTRNVNKSGILDPVVDS